MLASVSNSGKQFIIKCMRQTGILPLAENMRREIAKIRVRRANKRFCHENIGVAIPPTTLSYDPLGNNDYAWYWATGRFIAQHILERILSSPSDSDPIRVLEWGCGPARIIRHLAGAQTSRRMEYFGTDYNAELIDWCRSNLKGIDFRVNRFTPPLDFSDGFFDFVYCISVFTHLSEEMHHAWLTELLRVTKAGGTILMTLHGNNYRGKLLSDELIKFDQGELVARGGVHEGSRMYAAFHGEKFVRERFLKNVDVISVDHRADNPIAGPQSVWVIRKPYRQRTESSLK